MGDGTWLTLGEALERLNAEPMPIPISYSTLRRMVERGEVPVLRIGSRRDRRIMAKVIGDLKARMWAEANPEPEAPSSPTGGPEVP